MNAGGAPESTGARFADSGYPAMFQAANAASIAGQRSYLRLARLELMLLLIGAALGSIAAFNAGLASALPGLAAVSFLAAATLKVVARDRRYDKQWFDGRAVAETVKSTSWRYIMRVPPFEDDATADLALTSRLKAALGARPDLHSALAASPGGARQISPEMRAARGEPLPERRERYRSSRLLDQMDWYRAKSQFHRERATRFFWLSLITELGALAVAGVGLFVPDLARFNLLGLLAAIATAATAISHLNRHDELSKSYGLAFQELSLIDGLAERVEGEANLKKVVEDAESAISREHTMWIAKVNDEGRRGL